MLKVGSIDTKISLDSLADVNCISQEYYDIHKTELTELNKVNMPINYNQEDDRVNLTGIGGRAAYQTIVHLPLRRYKDVWIEKFYVVD